MNFQIKTTQIPLLKINNIFELYRENKASDEKKKIKKGKHEDSLLENIYYNVYDMGNDSFNVQQIYMNIIQIVYNEGRKFVK